ncbi:hypothetical protein TNCV_2608761 [Trichonephila clavipes]|uniref:Uncharacterized protein n=1 Tax=Trichonephila clavipes TaxID=2585209 RepID=A0A8X6RYV8_TRICX|nr:hypothetical protein TNCV_2608761 [Trichonephila clavipes]
MNLKPAFELNLFATEPCIVTGHGINFEPNPVKVRGETDQKAKAFLFRWKTLWKGCRTEKRKKLASKTVPRHCAPILFIQNSSPIRAETNTDIARDRCSPMYHNSERNVRKGTSEML